MKSTTLHKKNYNKLIIKIEHNYAGTYYLKLK